MLFRFTILTLPLMACTLVAVGAQGGVSKQHADAFARKVAQVAAHDASAAKPGAQRTPVSETEVNSWFAFRAQPLLPQGVSDPRVTIIGGGKVGGHAIVDLDAVAKKRSTGGMMDPWSYIGGKMPVAVTGTLHTKDGVGRFELATAEVSGVPVPATLLQELVSYYSRSPNHPQGIRIDDPFQLPAGIQRIEVGQGQATIVQ